MSYIGIFLLVCLQYVLMESLFSVVIYPIQLWHFMKLNIAFMIIKVSKVNKGL